MEDMCTGCLSTGRKLFFIGDTGYYHIYSQIMNEISMYDLSVVCVLVCWECRARLRGFHLFRQRAVRSLTELLQQSPLHSTSTLSCQLQHNLCFPEHPPDMCDLVVKTEDDVKWTEEHCEPEPFADALSPEPADDDQSEKNTSNTSRNTRAKEHIKPEPYEPFADVLEPLSDDDSDKPLKKKRKAKIALKTNRIKVKKKHKKAEIIHAEDNKDDTLEEKNYKDIVREESMREKELQETVVKNKKVKVKKKHKKAEIKDTEDNNEVILEEKDYKDIVREESVIEKELPPVVDETVVKLIIVKEKLPVVRSKRGESTAERPQCQECGKVFSSKKTYRYHLNVLHKGQNRYPCPRCGKVYQWKSNLGRHMRSHKAVDDGELFCAVCDKSFASVATYRQHLRLSRTHVPEAEFSFACEECGKRFVNKTRLRDHIDWEHLNRIKFRCQLCDKPFKCHTSLYVHTQNVHVGKEKKDNLCHVCGKSYQNAAKLKYHITAMHSGETPYRCAHCAAAFGWYSSLYRHMREVHYKMKGVGKKAKKSKQREETPQYVPL